MSSWLPAAADWGITQEPSPRAVAKVRPARMTDAELRDGVHRALCLADPQPRADQVDGLALQIRCGVRVNLLLPDRIACA